MAPQISRLDHLPTPQNFDYIKLHCSLGPPRGKEQRREISIRTPHASLPLAPRTTKTSNKRTKGNRARASLSKQNAHHAVAGRPLRTYVGRARTGAYMGLLDQLWDDTVAGPRPDSGLGKLRKYASFSPSSSSAAAVQLPTTTEAAAPGSAPPPGAVTRSVTMLRRPAALSVVTSPRSESSSAPSSPSPASGAPDSPFGAGDRLSPPCLFFFFSSCSVSLSVCACGVSALASGMNLWDR
jgi:hypothetical protein